MPATEEIIDILVYLRCQNSHFQVSVILYLLLASTEKEISRSALKTVLKEGIKDNGVIFDEDEISHMVEVMMAECDDNFTFSSIVQILDDHPELYESLSAKYEQLNILKSRKN